MTLTIQQNECLQKIKAFLSDDTSQVFILKGYAGTGKTTLIKSITDYLDGQKLSYQLMAPTGRAAKVLKSKIPNHGATTIHRGIYSFSHVKVNEENDNIKFIFPLSLNQNTPLCIVDEASMVSSVKNTSEMFQFGTGILLDDLLSYAQQLRNGKVIFVGDPLQLPPVGDSKSNALDESYLEGLGLKVATAELTDIVRQDKDSKILANAMTIRQLYTQEIRNELVFEKKENEVMDMPVHQVAASFCDGKHGTSAIICFSNHQASEYNRKVRSIIYPLAKHVEVGDRLMIVNNNYNSDIELLNGDFITVIEVNDNVVTQSAPVWTHVGGKKKRIVVSLQFRMIKFQTESGCILEKYIIESLLENQYPSLSVEEMKAMYINTIMRIREKCPHLDVKSDEFVSAVMGDEFYGALHVKYGYAFTCHKSQGGEWDTVYVDFDKRTGLDKDSLRWKYTAVTRARKMLWCVNLPDITPISKLKVTAIVKTGKIASDALSFLGVADTPYHRANSLPGVKAKYWSVVHNMEGSSYKIVRVQCGQYRDTYTVATPEGEIRVDGIYNGAGLFTRYEYDGSQEELAPFMENEENMPFTYEYTPSIGALEVLYHRIVSLCDEIGIQVTNIVEGNYMVTYYLRASGRYAAITFYYNAKGFVSYVSPVSDLGTDDEKLKLLIQKMQ